MKLSKALGAAAALAVATAWGSLGAQATERLSISTWGSPKHYQVEEFIPQFKKLLEEKGGGEFRVKSFDGGEMVKQQFVATAIPQGVVDISLTTLDNWSGRVPDVSILTSPLWTESMDWTLENLKPGNPIFDYFDTKLREQGAVILVMFDIGPPVVTGNFKVTGPESFEGKAVRVYSKGAGEVLQALGASPTIMGVGDVYSALQRGTVDAALGGLGGAVGLKHYEVASDMFVPNGVLGTLIHAYVMNKDKFDSMSPEDQKILMEAAEEARDHMQRFAIDNMAELLDEVRTNGTAVTTVEPGSDMWNAFAAKLEPLAQQARKDYSPEIVDLVTSQ